MTGWKNLLGVPPAVEPRSIELAGATEGLTSRNREAIEHELRRSGWALLRASEIVDAAAFVRIVSALGFAPASCYGDLPPSEDTANVFGTTVYPAEMAIQFHNEASNQAVAPRRIAFLCIDPAAEGGETPLSDGRAAFTALPGDLAFALEGKGLCYHRHFIPGLDVSWQRFFGTADRGEAVAKATASGSTCHWLAADVLSLTSRQVAVLKDLDGNKVLFQQVALHHPAFLPAGLREDLTELCGAVGLPRGVTFGDGTPISDALAQDLHRAQASVAVSFRWRRGDVLLVDNFRIAHARQPFAGYRRHLVVLDRFCAPSLE